MMLRIVLWASLALASIYAWQEWRETETLYPDVWAFWSFARYAATHAPAIIYDDHALHLYQAELGLPAENGFYPFPYPPWFLLIVTPLGWLPYPAAALLWRGVTFGALVWAVGAWRWRWDRALLLAVAPACVLGFVVGQNGFLTAALMLGGLRLLPGRPWLGGALLGACAYKPQLAVLVPVFLVFGRHWRAVGGAALAAMALTAATVLAFGIQMWPAWLASMQAQVMALTAGRGPKLDIMPTVTAAVQLLGGGTGLARVMQGIAALAAVALLWRMRGTTNPAVLPLAAFVTTPYAFGYDLPVVAAAALLALPAAAGVQQVMLLLCVLAPCVLSIPGAVILLPVLFCVTLGSIAWSFDAKATP